MTITTLGLLIGTQLMLAWLIYAFHQMKKQLTEIESNKIRMEHILTRIQTAQESANRKRWRQATIHEEM